MTAADSRNRQKPCTLGMITLVIASLMLLVLDAQAQSRSRAEPFEELTLKLPFTVTHNVMVADVHPAEGNELLILGHDEQMRRLLAVYTSHTSGKTPEQISRITLPETFLFFDLVDSGNGIAEGIAFLSSSAVHRYIASGNRFEEIAQVDSIYLQAEQHFLARKDFVRDLNGDGHADLLVSDFRRLQIRLGDGEGQWREQQLPIPAEMRIFDNNPLYSDPRLFLVDAGQSGPQLYHVSGNRIDVYRLQQNGQYHDSPATLSTGLSFHSEEWWELQSIDGQSPDQGNLQHRRLIDINDLNNDGLADLVFKHSRNSGVFEQRNDYEFHFGRSGAGGLKFNAVADSAISSDSTQFDLRASDLNNDGRTDLTIPSLKLGVGQVISALLSGEVDLDYDFYTMGENDAFNTRPNLNREVEMKFNLTSGRSGNPLVQVADFTGDENVDLLVNRGDNRIALHAGNSSDNLFVRRAQVQRVQLPRDGDMTTTADINADDKHDILLRYGREDGEGMMSTLTVLLAR